MKVWAENLKETFPKYAVIAATTFKLLECFSFIVSLMPEGCLHGLLLRCYWICSTGFPGEHWAVMRCLPVFTVLFTCR